MENLPVLLKRAVRDEWDNAESDIQKERKSLEALLGVEVKLAVEWPLLWTELNALYPDKNVFVPNIVSVTRTLFRSLNVKLEDEENTAWNDLFLEEITKAQGFRVSFATTTEPKPHFKLDKRSSTFSLALPSKDQPSVNGSNLAIEHDLTSVFGNAEAKGKGDDDNGWDDVTDEVMYPSRSKASPAVAPTKSISNIIPAIRTMARPEQLFTTLLPYHLIVTSSSRKLTIQGSHEPSLIAISDYFEKWTKRMEGDSLNRPMLKFELRQSCFGMSTFFDTLVIAPPFDASMWSLVEVNPVMFLAFIESILKYKVLKAEGSTWHYTQNEPLVRE